MVADYKLPFGDQVGPQPSNDQMKKLVVYDDVRPSIPQEWQYEKVRIPFHSIINYF